MTATTRVGLRAASRTTAQVFLGSAASIAVILGLLGRACDITRTAPVAVAVLAGAVCGLFATIAGVRAYAIATARHRWLTRQFDGTTDPGDPLGSVVTGLRARAQTAEGAARAAVDQAQRAVAGMSAASSTAVTAEESVRAHMVAELHDTVAQTLVVAGYCAWDDDADKDTLIEHVRLADRQLRDLMFAQRPPQLESQTLADAVSNLTSDLGRRHQVNVALDWAADPVDVPYAHAVVVYRFIQEGVQNAAKHAGVDTVTVTFAVDDHVLCVDVSDAGVGFDVGSLGAWSLSGRHIGLDMMRRRARMLHGVVLVDSRPGQGTHLVLRLPVPDPQAGAGTRR